MTTKETKEKFRNRYDEEKYREILQALVERGPTAKTVLMYVAESSTSRFDRVLMDLYERGLVKDARQLRASRWKYPLVEITPTGKKLLDRYNRLSSLIDWSITGTGRN
jgi:predicted transcriptional regulator